MTEGKTPATMIQSNLVKKFKTDLNVINISGFIISHNYSTWKLISLTNLFENTEIKPSKNPILKHITLLNWLCIYLFLSYSCVSLCYHFRSRWKSSCCWSWHTYRFISIAFLHFTNNNDLVTEQHILVHLEVEVLALTSPTDAMPNKNTLPKEAGDYKHPACKQAPIKAVCIIGSDIYLWFTF